MVRRLGHYDVMSKKDWKHLRCEYKRRMERVKWTDKIKNAVVLERVGGGTDKEEEMKLAGPVAKKKLSAEVCSRRNDKQEKISRQKI